MRRIALVLLALLLPAPAWAVTMSLGATYADGNSSAASPFDISYVSTTAGRGMVCGYEIGGNSSTITSVTVGSDNATALTLNNNATLGYSTQIWYVTAMTGSGTQTVRANWSAGGNVIYGICQELYSDAGGIAIDGSNQATGNSTSSTTSFNTGSANSALIGFSIVDSGPHTIGSGFTSIRNAGTWNFEALEQDLDAGAAGAKTVDFTVTSGQWAISAAGFTAASGGAAETFGFLRRLQVQP